MRYLDDEIKACILDKVNLLKANGEIDKRMIKYINEINGLDGVCTQSCCEGHVRKKHYRDAYLNIYMRQDIYDDVVERLIEVQQDIRFKNVKAMDEPNIYTTDMDNIVSIRTFYTGGLGNIIMPTLRIKVWDCDVFDVVMNVLREVCG